MTRSWVWVCLLIGASVVCGPKPAQAHHDVAAGRTDAGTTITTPTGTTLGRGRIVASFSFAQQRYNAIPAGDAHALHHQGRHIHGKNHEETYALSVGAGLLSDLDVFATVPLVFRSSIQVDEHESLGRKERSEGLGDVRLLAKYRFWRRGADAALLVGVKAPTGGTEDVDRSGNLFESEQQPGTGSWDASAGVAVSKSLGAHAGVSTALQYVYNGKGAQDHSEGDVLRYDLAGSYAVRPVGEYPNASVLLELSNRWAGQDRSHSDPKVFDSGGTTILLGPGISIDMNERLSAFFSMPVPIYQNLGGEHEELKYELITGVSWTF